MTLAADIAAAYAAMLDTGMAVTATWLPNDGSEPIDATVILDVADVALHGDIALGVQRVMRYIAVDLPLLARGDRLDVDGTSYCVAAPPRRMNPGDERLAQLMEIDT